jgi:hypothetical protein
MKSQLSKFERRRCLIEQKRLEAAVRACDICSESYKEHRKCYQRAEKEINLNTHNCLMV